MSMRTADFPALAARLRNAALTFEKWAPVAQAVSEEKPSHVPPMVAKGADRPVEALVMAREDQGIAGHLAAVRVSAIQAVLHAENAITAAGAAERAFSVTPTGRRPPLDAL